MELFSDLVMLSVHTKVKPYENTHVKRIIVYIVTIYWGWGPLYYVILSLLWDPKLKPLRPHPVGLHFNKQTVLNYRTINHGSTYQRMWNADRYQMKKWGVGGQICLENTNYGCGFYPRNFQESLTRWCEYNYLSKAGTISHICKFMWPW